MAAAAAGDEVDLELEVAAILCDLKRLLRARNRRRMRRRAKLVAPAIPSWGQRRLRSVLDEGSKPLASATAVVELERDANKHAAAAIGVVGRVSAADSDFSKPVAPATGVVEKDGAAGPDFSKPVAPATGVVERDGAASPDTPLVFPDSVTEDEEMEEDAAAAQKERAHEEWVQQQRVVVANLSQENADLLKQIEECKARLLSSRSTNERLKQLHKVRRQQEQAQARKVRMLALRHGMTMTTRAIPNPQHPLARQEHLVELDERTVKAMAEAHERHWQAQQQKAAVTAEARRRRLQILRGKVASCRTTTTRRVVR